MAGVSVTVDLQVLTGQDAGDPSSWEGGGRVLHLDVGSWSYGRGCEPGRPVVVVVVRLRHDLAKFYGNRQIWVEGHAPGCSPDHAPCRQLLARSDALAAAGWVAPRQ